MRRALRLARKGEGFTCPNPMVGAVLVRRGRVIGEGYHAAAGLPHAEINALADARAHGRDPAGATLYVPLEPCCHVGRTPPCSDAILEAGVSRVIIGVTDANPCVAGGGVLALRAGGISVITGVLEKTCRRQNEPFFHHVLTGRPLVVIKAACSLDGKIATRTGHSQWISGPKALRYAHRLRARYDAICVGVGTVLADDPQLTYRGSRKVGQPLRVILDSTARTPPQAKVVCGTLPGRTLIAVTAKASKRKIALLTSRPGVEAKVFPSRQGRIHLPAVVDHIGQMGCNSLLIEGGGTVLAAVIDAQLADQLRLVIAPMIIGGKDATPVVGGRGFATLSDALRLENLSVGKLGGDLLIRARILRRDIRCDPL